MQKYTRHLYLASIFALIFYGTLTHAQTLDVDATVKAVRIANVITGGFMPVSDPLFPQMVTKISEGDVTGAALIATNSKYFASYLGRRLAFQMQNPALDASIVTDNDATAYLIAHFTGAGGTKPSISSIWSENATYLVVAPDSQGVITPQHAADLTPAQIANLDWAASLVRMPGQNANVVVVTQAIAVNSPGLIPQKHVGGYVTLSDRVNDNSFAMYGLSGGTNLRMIEGIWEVATGNSLLDMASDQALAQDVPNFIPEYDPNFFHGQGQPACIACHGGGLSSIPHGYSTVGDMFDFDTKNGITFFATLYTANRKSLGSDQNKRSINLECNLRRNPTAVCNPDSSGVDPNQGWDVSKTWQNLGVLTKIGWTGPTSGQGLNELGMALGKATAVYTTLVKRVIGEICPLGTFSAADISNIAAAANPNTKPTAGTDDIRTIVARVASQSTCL